MVKINIDFWMKMFIWWLAIHNKNQNLYQFFFRKMFIGAIHNKNYFFINISCLLIYIRIMEENVYLGKLLSIFLVY